MAIAMRRADASSKLPKAAELEHAARMLAQTARAGRPAEALHATGAAAGARSALDDARARMLGIAAKIPDPDYRQGFLERVPEHARTLALARAWLGEPAAHAEPR